MERALDIVGLKLIGNNFVTIDSIGKFIKIYKTKNEGKDRSSSTASSTVVQLGGHLSRTWLTHV